MEKTMKKFVLLFVLTHCMWLFGNEITGTLTFDQSHIQFDTINGYDLVDYDDENIHFTNNAGSPDIPIYTFKLVVPANAVNIRVTADNTSITPVADNFNACPAQHETPLDNKSRAFTGPDAAIYDADAVYPAGDVITINTQSILRGYRIIDLQVNLFSVNPVLRHLYFLNELEYTVSYDMARDTGIAAYPENTVFTDLVKSSVVNTTDVDTFYTNAFTRIAAEERVDCLIITNEALKAAFEDYARIREVYTGLTFEVKTLQSIYAEYNEATEQLKIKRCCADYARTKNTMYVILGGDDTIVPVKYCYTYLSINDPDLPCDLFYSCFDNQFDWNSDGDGKVGETNDGGDYNPDVFIGRLLFTTPGQVAGYSGKVLKYISRCRTDEAFVKRLLMAGTTLSSPGDAKNMSNSLETFYIKKAWDGYTKVTLFDSDQAVTKQAFLNILKPGNNIMHMACHGKPDSWALTKPDRMYGTDALLTTGDAAVIKTIACKTNGFDMVEPCLSEGFIRNPDNDLICYIGASRDGYGDILRDDRGASISYSRYFFKNLLADGLTYEHIIGAALARAKTDMVGNIGSNRSIYGNRSVHFSLNLIGDPTIEFYEELQAGGPTPTLPPTPTATVTPTPSATPTATPYYINIAPGKQVKASGQYSPQFPVTAVNDDNPATVWGSKYNAGPQWFFIDLGNLVAINHVMIHFYNPYYSPHYFIGVSDDGVTWDFAAEETNGAGGIERQDVKRTARYVGIYLTKGAQKVYGVKEFEIYAPVVPATPTPTMTPGPTATPEQTPTPSAPQYPAWKSGVPYNAGDTVTYNGKNWRCTTAHTSNAAWYPGATGVYLWTEIK